MTASELNNIRSFRDKILSIAARHGAKNVRIFGSVARGQAGPKSDLDILVDPSPPCSPFFPGGLVYDLEELLGRRVDVIVGGASIHNSIRDNILKEAIPL